MTAPRKRTALPSSMTSRARSVRRDYIKGVRNGDIPMPEKGTPEARSLARLAALARWGKGPKAMKTHSVGSGIREMTDKDDRFWYLELFPWEELQQFYA